MASSPSRRYEREWKRWQPLPIAVLLQSVSMISTSILLFWSIGPKHTSTTMRFTSISSSTDQQIFHSPRSSTIIKRMCCRSWCKKKRSDRSKRPPLTSRSKSVSMNPWTMAIPMNRWLKRSHISRSLSTTITMVSNVCAASSISISSVVRTSNGDVFAEQKPWVFSLDDRESILHDQWYFGLISYTFLLKESVKIVNSSVMKLLQQQLKQCDTFWLSNGLKKRPIFNDAYFNIGKMILVVLLRHIGKSCCKYFPFCLDDTPGIGTGSDEATRGGLDAECAPIPTTRLNKFRQLARCFFHINCQMEWSSGALVAMNAFSPYEKLAKQPQQKWQLRFCEDFVDFIYQNKEKCDPQKEYIKRLQANFIDKSVIITTSTDGFVLYVQMKGNVMEITSKWAFLVCTTARASFVRDVHSLVTLFSKSDSEPWWLVRKRRAQNLPVMTPRQAMQRQSSPTGPQPFCSTIRISIKVSTLKDSSQRKHCRRMKNATIDEYDFRMDCILISHIRLAFREFLAFFYRHRIQICFAGSIADLSFQAVRPRIERPIFNNFIKNYSWQMLLSIGHRFQQRLKQEFIDHLKSIEDDHDFYQVSISPSCLVDSKLISILDEHLYLGPSKGIPFPRHLRRDDEVCATLERHGWRTTSRSIARVFVNESAEKYGLCSVCDDHTDHHLCQTVEISENQSYHPRTEVRWCFQLLLR